MNLLEILITLRGMTTRERGIWMDEKGVHPSIRGEIDRCFDANGNWLEASTGNKITGLKSREW